MKGFKLTYFIIISLLTVLISCNSTKNVHDGLYLLDKNEIEFTDEKLNLDEINTIIRQQPNRKTIGVKLKLYTFNWIDSAKVVLARNKQFAKIVKKNTKRKAKQKRINEKRILKAREKGDSVYTEKIIPLKDSINLRLSLREWIKYKRGEKPVIFDSVLYQKSITQLGKYMKSKGYYYGNVTSSYSDDLNNPKKRTVKYTIHSGKPYYIDSIIVDCPNQSVLVQYNRFIKKQIFNPILGEKFDESLLDNHRFVVAKHMRDNALYGFSPTNISYVADTANMKLKLKIIFSDRQIKESDSTFIYVKHMDTRVKNVYFHIIDTNYFKGSYSQFIKSKGLELKDKETNMLHTFDTLFYNKIYWEKKQKKRQGIPLDKDSLNPWRFAYILYNGKPSLRPEILELQNYLENLNTYKEYYIDRSYNSLVQLDVFQTIKPVITELKGTNNVEVHYYLVPAKKQSVNFSQKFTNSNSFLGLSASVNYNNKNLFRGSEKLTLSFGGGFESQPPVFQTNLDGSPLKTGRSFNTFEIGPSAKLDLPGLLLIKRAAKQSKRNRPRTVLSSAYNYQKRTDFTREVFQLNFMWKFYPGKTQVLQVGIPAAAIKFVKIAPSDSFRAKLEASNDLFLRNAYSNQFVWENFKMIYEYNNKLSDHKKKYNIAYIASLTSAGWILSKMNLTDTTATGQKTVFGVAYSRFIRVDNDVIYSLPLNKKTSVHGRGIVGIGVPRGNNTTSLPYDYSFFAGGANDNRGWRARSLGPGSYKYYLDSNRTATQLGDIRIGLFGELRYNISSIIKTAFFVDAGNIWTYQQDNNRVGGQFSKNFYKEIALSTGLGLRFDFTFLIIRLDVGFPITNPALTNGSRWIFQYWNKKDVYINEGIAVFAKPTDSPAVQRAKALAGLPKPFLPAIQFGIGFPF